MKNNQTFPNYILATKNIRFLNFVIDILFLKILKVSIYILSVFVPFGGKTLLDWLNSFDNIQNYLFFSLLMFIYYSLFEIFFSRTISKYFTNTIVVLPDGSKPKPYNIFARSLLRIVPFEYLTFLQGRKLGWHDYYSDTFVVKKDKLKQFVTIK